jgi:signal transduction histidine kinase
MAGLVFLLGVFGGQAAAAEPLPRSVLVLDPADARGPFYNEIFASTRSVLNATTGAPVTLYAESLSLARFSGAEYEASLRSHFRFKYRDNPIGVVIAVSSAMLDFALRNRTELWPGAAVVFAMAEEPALDGRNLPPGVTGRGVRLRLEDMVVAARALVADLSTVALVGDSLRQGLWRHFEEELPAATAGLAVIDLTGLKLKDVRARVASLPDRSAILYTGIYSDGEGSYLTPADAVAHVAQSANRPIVVTAETFVGPGGTGGFVMMPSIIGQEAAELALRILDGEPVSNIPIAEGRSVKPVFDWRQLRRWDVSENRLPPGSEIRFRDPSPWEQYRFQIVAAFTVVLLQAGMIGWLLYEHRRRLRSEASAHQLSRRLIKVGEQERARLARELHDDVTQRLALLAIDAGREESGAAGAPRAVMRSMREGLIRLSEDVHALSYRLHPSLLEDLGLFAALQTECERFSRSCPTYLNADPATLSASLPNDVALCLYRVAQEALRNAGRHAQATRTDVRLERLDGGLELVVTDNGVGFDPGRLNGASLGHASMRQRVLLLGGRFHIDSSPGEGTAVHAWVPLRENGSGTSARAAG